jgi:hypothetical protein
LLSALPSISRHAKAALTAPSNPEVQRHLSSESWSRLRHRPAPVFPQQIAGRLDHQGLDGRNSLKGEQS